MNIANFIERYIKLKDKAVKLYPYQKRFLSDPSDFRIYNKARQIGITQLIAWEALVYCLFKKELAVIVSVSERQARDVLQYVLDAYESLPTRLRLEKGSVWTKTELKWKNGSRFLSLPNNPRTVRGKPITRLYIDEFAHFQNDRELFDAVLPSISRGGKATFISTPLGKRGEFHRLWTEKNISKHETHYKECPDILSKIKIIKSNMPEEQFRQEYDCAFLDEAVSYFPYQLIMSCIDDDMEGFKPTRNPIFVGVDFGKKIDSSVIIVVEKIENMFYIREITEFKPPLNYSDVTDYITRRASVWSPNRIIIDQTGVGEKLIESCSKKLGSLVRGEILSRPYKEKIIANLKVMMQDGRLRMPRNADLFNQIHALQKTISVNGIVGYRHPTSGKIQHDDYVWALALATYTGEVGGNIGGSVRKLKGSVFDIGKDKDFTFREADY